MKDKFVTSGIFLIVLLVVSLYLAPFIKNIEGFTGLYDLSVPGIFPKSVDQAILDDYPKIGKNETIMCYCCTSKEGIMRLLNLNL